mmetsp:Transcript_9449/g.29858  ORF Transcript_9449/g.29858 Transcript_9449/m.29858 type:complete len:217 (-) Transcript_9449:103-753(-)
MQAARCKLGPLHRRVDGVRVLKGGGARDGDRDDEQADCKVGRGEPPLVEEDNLDAEAGGDCHPRRVCREGGGGELRGGGAARRELVDVESAEDDEEERVVDEDHDLRGPVDLVPEEEEPRRVGRKKGQHRASDLGVRRLAQAAKALEGQRLVHDKDALERVDDAPDGKGPADGKAVDGVRVRNLRVCKLDGAEVVVGDEVVGDCHGDKGENDGRGR